MKTTPKEFKTAMELASISGNTEEMHIDMDDLMCNLLIELGYGDGIEVFKNTNKWYA